MLAIQGGGIVHAEKRQEQVLVAELRRIETNLQRLGVASNARRHQPVSWIRHFATGVPDACIQHAGNLADDFLHAPEAAAGKESDFTLRGLICRGIRRRSGGSSLRFHNTIGLLRGRRQHLSLSIHQCYRRGGQKRFQHRLHAKGYTTNRALVNGAIHIARGKLFPMSDFDFRFGGIGRLFGVDALARLRAAHVCVVGIGGVGSWAVEALARSGIGRLTLVDLDEVCVSNVNRQLHAINAEVGRPKVEVMAERVRGINPECDVRAVPEFFTESSANALLSTPYDSVVDAIDSLANKCRLIALCREKSIPLVTCGGAGGRRDPTAVRVADLAFTTHDRLLQKVRETLRRDFGFPRGEREFGIDAVYSPEPLVYPARDGSVCAQREASASGQSLKLNCDSGFGTATFVTGTFGFAAAARVVQRIAANAPVTPQAV